MMVGFIEFLRTAKSPNQRGDPAVLLSGKGWKMKRCLYVLFISAFVISTVLAYAAIRLWDNSHNDTYHPMSSEGQVVWTGSKTSNCNRRRLVLPIRRIPRGDSDSELSNNVSVVPPEHHGDDGQEFFDQGSAVAHMGSGSYNGCSPWINSKGEVVWQGWDGHDHEVLLYDGSNTIHLTNNSYDDIGPQINDQGWVAWRQFDGEDYEIWVYDGSTIRQLTDNSYSEGGLQLNDRGQMVWWAEPDGEGREIFFYDGSAIVQLARDPISGSTPRLNAKGDVVWHARGQVFLYDGTTVRKIVSISKGRFSTSRDRNTDAVTLCREHGGDDSEMSLCLSSPQATGQHTEELLDRHHSVSGENRKRVWADPSKVFPAISDFLPRPATQMTCLNRAEVFLAGASHKITSGSSGDAKGRKGMGDSEGLNKESLPSERREKAGNTPEILPEDKKKKGSDEQLKHKTIDWQIIRIIGSSILKYSREYDVDPALVLAIINAESEFEHSSISDKGAIGLMQLMPQTADQLSVDPYDIEENIKGGIKHLRFLLSKFDSTELAIAAYNAGSTNVKKYKGVPPFKETKRYVRKVLAYYEGKKS